MSVESQLFSQLLMDNHPELSAGVVEKLVTFRELVVDENSRQNLTRLLNPKDFYEGHVLDSMELLRSGLVSYPAIDLGSGAGAPGMICAILGGGPWVLCDSEKKKAEFLERAANQLELLNRGVSVTALRAEDYLKDRSVVSIVARAVGPVMRVYAWLGPRSTWNNLVLLKGPGWVAEYEEFCLKSFSKQLRLNPRAHQYEVGEEKKQRIIVRLDRVRA